MYVYVTGTLVEACPTHIVLDVQGIGYEIAIPVSLYMQLPPLQSSMQIFTTFVIREFSQTLYGFLQARERDLFALLIEAKGVGPKMALSLLGHLPLEVLLQAIRLHDAAALSKVPGIGKKTAERLLIELHDKVEKWGTEIPLSHQGPVALHPVTHDAINALVHLGYSASIARQAVQKSVKELPEECEVGQLITAALTKI